MESCLKACRAGDIQYINKQINREGKDDNIDWQILLDTAYRHDQMNIVQILQDSERVNMAAMLKSACYYGDMDFVSRNLDCDVDCDVNCDVEWRSLLYFACVRGHSSLASLLQEKVGSADLALLACITTMPTPTCKLDYGELSDCLVDLCETGCVSAKVIMKACEDLTVGRHNIIRRLIIDKRFDILLDYEAVMDGDYVMNYFTRGLIQMYKTGHIDRDTCKFITRDSLLDPTAKFFIALCVGDTEFVYEADGQFDSVDWGWLIVEAYRNGHVELARYILEKMGVEVNYNILHIACVFGESAIIRKYLERDFTRYDAKTLPDAKIVRYMHNLAVTAPNILWDLLLATACFVGHVEIISLIAENRQLGWLDNHMLLACLKGDVDYVHQHVHTVPAGYFQTWSICVHAAILTEHGDIVDVLIQMAQQAGISMKVAVGFMVDIIASVEAEIGVYCDRNTLRRVCEKTGIIVPTVKFTPLHRACYIADHFATNILFQRWPLTNVNQTDNHRWTPLHVLCLGQNDEMDKIIVEGSERNMFVMMKQDKNKLLKHKEACHENLNGNVKILHLLVYHGALLDPVDDNLQTPLHLACSSGAYELVLCLLNYGANIDQVDGLGMTPIACAALNNQVRIIELLLKRKCNVQLRNVYGQNPLHHSCRMNHTESVNILITVKDLLDVQDEEGLTPIILCTMAENAGILEVLLAHDADANIDDNERQLPLHKAAIRGNYQCVNLLISRTSNINHQDISGSTALHLATRYQHRKLIDVLLNSGADANITDHLGNSALHAARDKDIISTVAKNSFKVDHQNHCGETPLMYAASRLDLLTLKELLANGADMNIPDNMGRSLLHVVVTSNHHGLVLRELFKTTIEMKTWERNDFKIINMTTILHGDVKFAIPKHAQLNKSTIKWKSISGSFFLSIIEYLLSIGMDIDARDYNKSSALHLAAESGYLTAVHVLLQNKARPAARDKFGHMPVMLALKHPQVFTLLWQVSQKYMMTEDMNRLFHLAHWADSLTLLHEHHIKPPPDFTIQHWADTSRLNVKDNIKFPYVEWGKAQNVRTLTFKIDPDMLSDWLRSANEDLPEFMSGWLPVLQPLTFVQHPYVIEVMDMLMADLEVSVRKIDPLVAFCIKRCGSEDEKTKVILKDEEDCSCVQENIRFDMFETPTHAGHPVWKAFVELVAKPEYYKHLERVLDEKKRLSQSKLCQHFGSAVAKALADINLWRKYPQLMRVTVKDITAGSRKISALLVLWSDDVYPLMEISVDLVPVIDLSGWYPAWCNQHPLIKHIDCIALPKWKMTHNIDLDLMEVGVFQWRPWFEMMPGEMRQGFRLAKVVKDKAVCPKIEEWDEVHAGEFISTYYLKQCIMKEYTEFYDLQLEGFKPEVHSDLYYARKIYDHLEDAFQKRELASICIPEYNLLNDDKFVQYQETAVSYARLCRRLLTPESVAHFKKAYMGMEG